MCCRYCGDGWGEASGVVESFVCRPRLCSRDWVWSPLVRCSLGCFWTVPLLPRSCLRAFAVMPFASLRWRLCRV